jgi:hypothetical protein
LNSFVILPKFLVKKRYFLLLLNIVLIIALVIPARYAIYFFVLPHLDERVLHPFTTHKLFLAQSLWRSGYFAMLSSGYFFAVHCIKVERQKRRLADARRKREREFRKVEKELMEMEIISLKNQINPHFLYNTLNFFYSQVYSISENTAKGCFKYGELTDPSDPVVITMQVENDQLFFSTYNRKRVTTFKEKSTGIGLVNIRRRLDLKCPNRYSLVQGLQHLRDPLVLPDVAAGCLIQLLQMLFHQVERLKGGFRFRHPGWDPFQYFQQVIHVPFARYGRGQFADEQLRVDEFMQKLNCLFGQYLFIGQHGGYFPDVRALFALLQRLQQVFGSRNRADHVDARTVGHFFDVADFVPDLVAAGIGKVPQVFTNGGHFRQLLPEVADVLHIQAGMALLEPVGVLPVGQYHPVLLSPGSYRTTRKQAERCAAAGNTAKVLYQRVNQLFNFIGLDKPALLPFKALFVQIG